MHAYIPTIITFRCRRMIGNESFVLKAFSRYHGKKTRGSTVLFPVIFVPSSPFVANECNEVPACQIKGGWHGTSGEPKFIVALSGTKVG